MGVPQDGRFKASKNLKTQDNTYILKRSMPAREGGKQMCSDHVVLGPFSHPLPGLRVLQVTDGWRLNPIIGLDIDEVYSPTHLCKAPKDPVSCQRFSSKDVDFSMIFHHFP